jgi:adenylate cyclase 3
VKLQCLILCFRCRRVHISEKTLSYLNGEFEVEPALGEKREETLRMAGIRTFFIVKALKPVSTTYTTGRHNK